MPKRISNEELFDLIKSGESVSFEYKGELNREIKERLSTYFAAFANTEGGYFVLGINNSKETVGYTLEKGEREYISQQAENCHPPVNIDIEEARQYDNNKIVLIYASKSNTIHTDKNHKFPIRVGSNLHYLDIVSLIPLAKERLGLTYGTGKPEFSSAYGQKKVITSEDIELCLKAIKGTNKDVILEGLRDLELFLIWDSKKSDEPRIIEVIEALLQNPEAEIRRKALDIIGTMIHWTENDESKKKLIEYSEHLIKIAKKDNDNEARSKAIRVLLTEMGDGRVIEPIIEVVVNESDEMYNRIKNERLVGVNDSVKHQLKSELLKELGKPKHPETIRKRIKESLEQTRWM